MPHKRAKRSVREKERAERVTDEAPPQASRNIREEKVPKSISRVLNASQIRSEWKESIGKRKKREEERDFEPDFQHRSRKKSRTKGSNAGAVSVDVKLPPMRIQPGESLTHFNKRVEDTMRPLVKSALQSSSARMRRSAKDVSKQVDGKSQKPLDSSDPLSSTKMKQLRDGTKPDPDTAQDRDPWGQRGKASINFAKASTSAPRSVNDVVQAPPQISRLPRNAKRIVAASGKGKKSDTVISMAQKVAMEAERENAIQRYRELKERRLEQRQKNIDPDSVSQAGLS